MGMLVFSLRCYEAAIPTGLPCMHKTAKNEGARIIGRQRMSEPMDKREEVQALAMMRTIQKQYVVYVEKGK